MNQYYLSRRKPLKDEPKESVIQRMFFQVIKMKYS